MKFIVVQRRTPNGNFETVAKCAHAEDAILFGVALSQAKPPRGPVQVIREDGRKHAYWLLVSSTSFPIRDDEVRKALDGCRKQERDYKAKCRAEKKRYAAISAYMDRFGFGAARQTLTDDPVFRDAVFGKEVRAAEADGRAAELGIFPVAQDSVGN